MSKKKSWNEVLGAFTSDKPGLTRIKTPKDNAPGTDWSKIVDEDSASTHNSGGGKLSNPGSRNK
jgi:hypothetical protein